ncbi:hypothetical protein JCM24511_01393 [Saitozyma sp. JCM 24511]|nr:hypothetical protein JCM24511_01393 [Saitozyma sp. JCM 24511]
MIDFIVTLLLASTIMVGLMGLGVALTMPFHGALIRLRANYNPKAIGLEGAENRVGPTLTSLFGTLRRVKRLEGWYGLYKGSYPMLAFTTLISIASVIFVGGSSTRGARGTYSVPESGGVQMALFTIVLTVISLPMTIIVNRAIITPYKLPNSARKSLSILLSTSELARPWTLYLTPGLLLASALHSLCVTFLARTMRTLFLGPPVAADVWNDVAWWRWVLFSLWQGIAAGWLSPLEVIATRLSVQPNQGGAMGGAAPDHSEGETPEGVEYCGADEDVIGLRPTDDSYTGVVDCARKLIEEEGWQSLYRGWWWTLLGNVAAVFA